MTKYPENPPISLADLAKPARASDLLPTVRVLAGEASLSSITSGSSTYAESLRSLYDTNPGRISLFSGLTESQTKFYDPTISYSGLTTSLYPTLSANTARSYFALTEDPLSKSITISGSGYDERMRLFGVTKTEPYLSVIGLSEAQRNWLDPVSALGKPDGGVLGTTRDYATMMATSSAKSVYESLFRRPDSLELYSLANSAFNVADFVKKTFGTVDQLQIAMGNVHSPWLQKASPATSGMALSEILAIGRGIDTLKPFDDRLTAGLREGLGDWRAPLTATADTFLDPIKRSEFYYSQGFDRNLTNFTPSAFNDSLRIARLTPDVEDPKDEHEEGLARARSAFEVLQQFETQMRRFIVSIMSQAFGPKWMKQRVPGPLLAQWRERQRIAMEHGQDELPLIEYADFTDYKAIIERNDNWTEVFKAIFVRRDDITEAFQRLFPLRLAVAHMRVLTLDDQLLLQVETKRMLKAIAKQ